MTLKTKNWESLTKIDLTKKLSFSSTFLEVHFLHGTNQSRPLPVELIISEFSEQTAEVITDGDDENEDEEWWTNCTSLKKWTRRDNQNFEQIKSVQRGFMFWSFNHNHNHKIKVNSHNQSVNR